MRRTEIAVMLALLSSASGCCLLGRPSADELTASQLHARELYAENQRLLATQQQAEQMLSGLDAEKQMLMQHLGQMDAQLQAANGRVENLLAERSQLTDRYAKSLTDGGSMLAGAAAGANLSAEGFEYDPATGLNKFRKDILFDLGSDALRREAQPILAEFASSVKTGSATGMRILVVGHTDDQQIVRPETARKHATNWHLSTDRADAVIQTLLSHGVSPDRIAAMGYSEFQPLESSVSESARQRNRRVELFVVPNDPSFAKWDPATSVR